jgi:hypothetical protein
MFGVLEVHIDARFDQSILFEKKIEYPLVFVPEGAVNIKVTL